MKIPLAFVLFTTAAHAYVPSPQRAFVNTKQRSNTDLRSDVAAPQPLSFSDWIDRERANLIDFDGAFSVVCEGETFLV
jgi:hypothetical protein